MQAWRAGASSDEPARREQWQGRKKLDELAVGEVVYYQHRDSGWVLVKVIAADREGVRDGGMTYVIGGAPQLNGAEIETERRRLFRSVPVWTPRGFWAESTDE